MQTRLALAALALALAIIGTVFSLLWNSKVNLVYSRATHMSVCSQTRNWVFRVKPYFGFVDHKPNILEPKLLREGGWGETFS